MRTRSLSWWTARGALVILTLSALLVALFAPGGGSVAAANPSYPIDPSDSKWGYVSEWAVDGQLYALYTSVNSNGTTMRLAQSPAGGSSWTTKFAFPASIAGNTPNYPRLASASNGVMHMVWSDLAGNGVIHHGIFSPGGGRLPGNINDWSFDVISGSGKNASMSLRPSDGVMVATWDDNGTAWGRTYNGGWSPAVELTGASGMSCDNPCLVAPALTGDSIVHVVHVDAGRTVTYNRFNLNWQKQGDTIYLSSAQANHWPQIVGDANNNVHVVWSQAGGPNGSWEVYYAMLAKGSTTKPSIERVSRNLNGTLDRFPTVSLDNTGNTARVHVAWSGDDAAPGQFRIYERIRGADSNPWPDYGDGAPYLVYCTGGDGQNAIYGFSLTGRVHLTYALDAGGNRSWGQYYSDRTASQAGSCGQTQPAPASTPAPTPAPSPPPASTPAPTPAPSPPPASTPAPTPAPSPPPASTPAPTPAPSPPPASTPAPTPAPSPPPAPTPSPEPSWSAWNSQGGVLTDSPAAAGFNGRTYLFARGSDNGLYVKSTADGASFTAWQPLGGVLTAAPAAATLNGQLYVFAKGADNALYVKQSSDGWSFTDWRNLGGVLTAPPAAAGVNGMLYLFAKGADNALYMMRTADGYSFAGWYNLGGVLTAEPAVAGFNNQVYVFAKGADNALYQKHSADGTNFTDWRNFGGVLTAAPAAATDNAGGQARLYLFARGADGALYERHTSDDVTYTDWVSLGGQLVGPPAAAGTAGQLFVFVRGSDDALYERHTLR